MCDAVLLDMCGTKCASITLDDIEGLLLTDSPDRILKDSCEQGSMFIVRKAIERGATNWNWGLRGACEGGRLELANLMIEKGATDWVFGLEGACGGGHLEIVNLMIEKGATNTSMIPRYFPDWKPK